MNNINFVAVDFETMTPQLTSACSVGLVKVLNGVIMKKVYTLIKPIPDGREERNTHVHGITDDMVSEAPTFKDIFPWLKEFIGDLPIVCHNHGTDINVFKNCMEYYGLTGINYENYIDTYELYRKGLAECCEDNGIVLANHHDALADAEACAKLYLCYGGCLSRDMAHYSIDEVMGDTSRRYDHDTLVPLDDDKVENKDTIFFKKKVVVTGKFQQFPDRDDLGLVLKKYGADVNTSISKKTNIVLVGVGAGPSKMKKIEELRASGVDIRVIYESEVYDILNNIK